MWCPGQALGSGFSWRPTRLGYQLSSSDESCEVILSIYKYFLIRNHLAVPTRSTASLFIITSFDTTNRVARYSAIDSHAT